MVAYELNVPDRFEPAFAGLDEREMLLEWLKYHHLTLLAKCQGLDDEQLRRRSLPPSSMSLLGLVRHVTDVDRHWFREILNGENAVPHYWSDAYEDGEFDLVDDADTAEAFTNYADERERGLAIVAAIENLDDLGKGGKRGNRYSARWVLTHLVEEYARHNGHADLLREAIDGETGE